jgi:hypothetical protein
MHHTFDQVNPETQHGFKSHKLRLRTLTCIQLPSWQGRHGVCNLTSRLKRPSRCKLVLIIRSRWRRLMESSNMTKSPNTTTLSTSKNKNLKSHHTLKELEKIIQPVLNNNSHHLFDRDHIEAKQQHPLPDLLPSHRPHVTPSTTPKLSPSCTRQLPISRELNSAGAHQVQQPTHPIRRSPASQRLPDLRIAPVRPRLTE